LATSLASPISLQEIQQEKSQRELRFAIALVTALTPLALLIHGYHPYAEDGGIYMPEIKRLLDPGLYTTGSEFVVKHLQYSLFAPAMAGLVRSLHLRLEIVLLLVHLVTFWITLFAAWLLAARCYDSRLARAGAVTLLAAWMTLPIAGTSLMLMDPYVTARSFSTPCALLALAGALEFLLPQFELEDWQARQRRGLFVCCAALAVAAVMHPLMAAYAFGSVVLLSTITSSNRLVRIWGTLGICLSAVATADGLVLAAPPENSIYQRIMLTRDYWFLNQWHCYEWVGLAAPILILATIGTRRRSDRNAARVGLSRMAVAAGLTAVVVALLFARPGMETHLVARLQPLRIFQIVYVIMTLALGASLAEQVLQRRPVRWVVAFSLLAGVMAMVERRTFPASTHIEQLSRTKNQWERAFSWIAVNTPRDAVFALDVQYITKPGEDAQGFRAIAERSALPDFSKDAGVVTNRPELAAMWLRGQVAQAKLNTETDADRIAALKPLGVTWLVLDSSAVTNLVCEYRNAAVKVCRLP
jgi:hypothetical protein